MAKHAPPGLTTKTRRFWREMTTAYDFRPDELRVLEDACLEMDLIDRLEGELVDAELMVRGSQGQLVSSPLVQEVRQHRTVLARLFAGLKLPEAEAATKEKRSTTAREAAIARWGRRGA